jgi:homoserine kinase
LHACLQPAFAPATVSNVACGFDVLGFALGSPGDEVTARFIDGESVRIDDITGDEGRLPRDATCNTAGIAAQRLLTVLGERRGVALTIRKGLPLSSGLGGSAASAVAAVVAVDGLLGANASRDSNAVVRLRRRACRRRLGPRRQHRALPVRRVRPGSPHQPADIVCLPVPDGLVAVVVHPHLEIETAHARALLGDSVRLADAIQQWANLGAFVDALHRADFGLLARSLEDRIAEPRRASLVPGS